MAAPRAENAAVILAALKDAIIAARMDSGAHARFDEVENRYRFIRYLERLESRDMLEYPADIRPTTR